ncbi:MAG: hypothetical protein J5814_04355, partial [Bacteroidaceae bacterium]|nr:hypothetical protein [Bacteroidaceae bacterium]
FLIDGSSSSLPDPTRTMDRSRITGLAEARKGPLLYYFVCMGNFSKIALLCPSRGVFAGSLSKSGCKGTAFISYRQIFLSLFFKKFFKKIRND